MGDGAGRGGGQRDVESVSIHDVVWHISSWNQNFLLRLNLPIQPQTEKKGKVVQSW